MADPAQIMSRIRSFGANILLDGSKLEIVNPGKLPAGASDFIRQNAKAIANFLDQEGEFEERAAIIEFDGRAPRDWAEQFAQFCISHRPTGVSDLDWSWFLTQAGRIVDEAPVQKRAA